MGSLPHCFGYESFILCVKESSSNVLLVRITNEQKQVSPSFFVDSAPLARLFDLPWALYQVMLPQLRYLQMERDCSWGEKTVP